MGGSEKGIPPRFIECDSIVSARRMAINVLTNLKIAVCEVLIVDSPEYHDLLPKTSVSLAKIATSVQT